MSGAGKGHDKMTSEQNLLLANVLSYLLEPDCDMIISTLSHELT